jgi:hypothetical protein
MRGIERRIIYVLMLLVVALPLIGKWSLKPAVKPKATELYHLIESLQVNAGEVSILWMDFGPNSKAENEAQTEVFLEHLFRKRIPVIVTSLYQLSEPFLSSIPARVAARLSQEYPGQTWTYGEDWINVGYLAGTSIAIQNLAKSSKISEFFVKDVNGLPLSQYPRFANIGGLDKVKLVAHMSGLVGIFDLFIQFLQKEGARPLLIHGCTSITIPEAYIFLDSGQLNGLLEGLAGAAWYSTLMSERHPLRAPDRAMVVNTTLGVAHLMLIALIIAGNVRAFLPRIWRSLHAAR